MKDKQNIRNFSGLYEEKLADHNPLYIFSESVRDRSSLFNWHIKPHIHTNLFQLFFVETGFINLKSDIPADKKINGPFVLIIPPGQVHGFEYDPAIEGRVITIADTYVEGLLKSIPEIHLALNNLIVLTEFDEEISFDELLDLTLQIHEDLFAEQPARQLALQALFSLLLVKLYRLQLKNKSEIQEKQSLSLNYYNKFIKSLKTAEPFTKTIPQFAAELGITPVHLNRICQKITGKPATGVLHDHIIAEAKSLLLYTSQSLSEIAYKLNFKDPAYFSRLFKQYTGVTPKAFREMNDR